MNNTDAQPNKNDALKRGRDESSKTNQRYNLRRRLSELPTPEDSILEETEAERTEAEETETERTEAEESEAEENEAEENKEEESEAEEREAVESEAAEGNRDSEAGESNTAEMDAEDSNDDTQDINYTVEEGRVEDAPDTDDNLVDSNEDTEEVAKDAVQKQKGKRTREVRTSKTRRKKFERLNTRNVPKLFVETMEKMKDAQVDCIREIGFGALLELKTREAPHHLGYWLAQKFDEVSCELRMANGDAIHITPEDVHRVFGIPLGGICSEEE